MFKWDIKHVFFARDIINIWKKIELSSILQVFIFSGFLISLNTKSSNFPFYFEQYRTCYIQTLRLRKVTRKAVLWLLKLIWYVFCFSLSLGLSLKIPLVNRSLKYPMHLYHGCPSSGRKWPTSPSKLEGFKLWLSRSSKFYQLLIVLICFCIELADRKIMTWSFKLIFRRIWKAEMSSLFIQPFCQHPILLPMVSISPTIFF